jgi:S-DNA-T family DNA segregation ATPase FtsK/SpoIIIE
VGATDSHGTLSPHVKRELAGSALLLFAVFLAGALLAGGRGDATGGCAAAGGIFGPVGSCLRSALTFTLGTPAAFLLCAVAVVHALRLFGRIRAAADRSWLVFLLGLVLLFPVGAALATGAHREITTLSGMWGSVAAFYLVLAFGAAGGWIVFLLAASALTAGTLAWNPLRLLIGPTGGDGRSKPEGEVDAGVAVEGWNDRADHVPAAIALAPSPDEMPSIATDDLPGAPAGETRRRRRAGSKAADQSADTDGASIARGTSAEVAPAALPPIDLLNPPPVRNLDVGRRELDAMGAKLLDALRTFRVEGELVGRTTGPVVTQFEIVPAAGVKVRQIATLADDLALAMRAQSIRIVAPIPGKGAVGVEVPNPTAEVVAFRELVESREFQGARAALPIGLGKDLEGRPVIADLAKMPHLLIAGATGSGKSVCINTLITSLIYRHTPETLRFLMVDPKMVELSVYNALPHLRHKVITDNRDAATVLKWALMEMQERYELLAANGCRNMQEFNQRLRDGATLQTPAKPDVAFEERTYRRGVLPYIVLVIDELADLMMTVQGEIETPLALLAQKARAIGIHLILATQRPSVNVITGLIKANFPSRIAFRVASQVDSRTILDGIGAEALLGNGDLLFIPPGKSEPARLQGAYITGEETERLIGWYGAQRELRRRARGVETAAEAPAEEDVLESVRRYEAEHADAGTGDGDDARSGERDLLFREAAEVVIHHQQGSTSLLQRRLKVGYGRAARIIDQLQAAGVLGPQDGSKPREVMVGLEDLPRICGRGS